MGLKPKRKYAGEAGHSITGDRRCRRVDREGTPDQSDVALWILARLRVAVCRSRAHLMPRAP
jgi:hypothetical protein